MENKYTISNGKLSVTISQMGAEIISVKENGRERLWQPDAAIWNGQAPNLFPVIGRMKGKIYTFDGASYTIEPHGFAKKSLFTETEVSAKSITLTLTSGADTKTVYPFDFSFSVRYTVEGKTLKKEFITQNAGNCDMFYEVGGHEGYNLNLHDGAKMSDYRLVFQNRDSLCNITSDKDIMLNKEPEKLTLDNGVLPLSMSLFKNDALILQDVAGDIIELWREHQKVLTVKFEGFPFLGIWTKYIEGVDTKYICIEPWTSLPDGNYLGHGLTEKIGVRRLPPNAAETLSYTMEF